VCRFCGCLKVFKDLVLGSRGKEGLRVIKIIYEGIPFNSFHDCSVALGESGSAGGHGDCRIRICNIGGIHVIVAVRGGCRSGRPEEDLTSSRGAWFRLRAGGQFGGRNWVFGSTQ
jgi:hypothetical protein